MLFWQNDNHLNGLFLVLVSIRFGGPQSKIFTLYNKKNNFQLIPTHPPPPIQSLIVQWRWRVASPCKREQAKRDIKKKEEEISKTCKYLAKIIPEDLETESW